MSMDHLVYFVHTNAKATMPTNVSFGRRAVPRPLYLHSSNPYTSIILFPADRLLVEELRHNNPSDLALEEARRIWVSVKRFALVSIGTGRQESVRFINSVAKSPDFSVPEQRPAKWFRTRAGSETASGEWRSKRSEKLA